MRAVRFAPLGLICAVGLSLRLWVVWSCLDAGLFSDMQDYHDRALHILHYGALPPDAFRPPGYPLFLAGIYAIFGVNLLAARVAQALLGTAVLALTYGIARDVAGRRAALAAAALVAVYPAWLLYPVYLMAENLFTCLTLAAIWLWGRGRWWASLVGGLALGTSILARAVGLATLAGLATASLRALVRSRDVKQGNRQPTPAATLASLACLTLGTVLALAPWAVRNQQRYGRPILTDTAGGYNFLLGNNPRATGRLELDDLQAVSESYWGHARDDAHRSEIGYEEGRKFILGNPGQAARLTLRKLGFLVGLEGREQAWAYSHHYHGRRSPGVVRAWGVALLVSFPLVFVAALAGLLRPGISGTPMGRAVLMILLFAAGLHLVSFGESRFHLPWVPLLSVAAARALAPEAGARWTRARAGIFVLTAGLLCAWWLVQAPTFLSQLSRLADSPEPLRLPY